ncbi:MAG: hypothetical protein L6R42_003709 [Xanthoria sp. 1 TBL-2021]|nr:MAG: hypothetical protein L6R42_003709 [Xanthoria sp. 1 TBL-2021]
MDIDQVLDTCALDLAYEKSLHQQYAVQEDERFRRLHVHLILLENHNETLQAQIADDDGCVQKMEQSQDALKAKIKKAETSLESTQGDLRIKSREIETLKAELRSLHGVTMNSTQLLTEKLALARELSTLRPEVDHLRSQVASNQTLLAQKLSLDHQLRTLEIQLETEKKSTQRILDNDERARSEDAKLESQLRIVQAELNRERRERQRLEREAQEASRTWEAQKVTVESRLDSLRNKLRTTKDSLKQTQQELNGARSVQSDLGVERAAPAQGRIAATKSRKRTATQMLSDSMIGTPGNETNDRRAKRVSTLPGDKSAFSITPYLNRTTSVGPESPPEENAASPDIVRIGKRPGGAQGPVEATSQNHQTGSADNSKSRTKNALGTSTAGKSNEKVAPGQKKLKTASMLEQVAEEENDETQGKQEKPFKATGPATGDDTTLGGLEVKRQRRRLLGGLGKTLFDEDDRELGRSGLGATTFGALSNRNILGPKSRPLLVASSASGNVSGAISPLKRNRQNLVT